MYIDPKPLQAIRYGKEEYLRANKFYWYVLVNTSYENIDIQDSEELEEKYQQCLKP
jgi:hypothetical protein